MSSANIPSGYGANICNSFNHCFNLNQADDVDDVRARKPVTWSMCVTGKESPPTFPDCEQTRVSFVSLQTVTKRQPEGEIKNRPVHFPIASLEFVLPKNFYCGTELSSDFNAKIC